MRRLRDITFRRYTQTLFFYTATTAGKNVVPAMTRKSRYPICQ